MRIQLWQPSVGAALRIKFTLVLLALTAAAAAVSATFPALVSYGLLALACVIECSRLPWAILDFVSVIASVATFTGFFLLASRGREVLGTRWSRWPPATRVLAGALALSVCAGCLWLMTESQQMAGQLFPQAKGELWRRIVSGTRPGG